MSKHEIGFVFTPDQVALVVHNRVLSDDEEKKFAQEFQKARSFALGVLRDQGISDEMNGTCRLEFARAWQGGTMANGVLVYPDPVDLTNPVALGVVAFALLIAYRATFRMLDIDFEAQWNREDDGNQMDDIFRLLEREFGRLMDSRASRPDRPGAN